MSENNETPPEPRPPHGLDIESIIGGLVKDMNSLRSGDISVTQARASADLGRQVFAGIRVMLQARRVLDNEAINVTSIEGPASDKKGA